MPAEQEPEHNRAAYREKVAEALTELEKAGPEDMAERARKIRAKLTGQLAAHVATARAAERDKLEQELAEALGIAPEQAAEFAWPTLISMVFGVRSIADIVIGTAAPDVNPDKRQELLASFGAAEYWARVTETAQRDGAQWRQVLGLNDRGRPMGDDRETGPPNV
jgi:hypothetical protein